MQDEKAILPFDVFSDGYDLAVNPLGCQLILFASPPLVRHGDGKPVQMPKALLGTVRLTVEHLKLLVFLAWRQVNELEAASKARFPVPVPLRDSLKVDPRQWAAFWGEKEASDAATVRVQPATQGNSGSGA